MQGLHQGVGRRQRAVELGSNWEGGERQQQAAHFSEGNWRFAMDLSGIEIIKRYFEYLIDEYGFLIEREEYSPEAMGNAYIVYTSKLIGIGVVVDRDQVLINIGQVTWPEREWFEFTDVIHYFNPNIKKVYAFSGVPLEKQNFTIEAQVKHVSIILRQYCEPILMGDFSMEDLIKEIERKRAKEILEHFKKLSEDYRKSKQ